MSTDISILNPEQPAGLVDLTLPRSAGYTWLVPLVLLVDVVSRVPVALHVQREGDEGQTEHGGHDDQRDLPACEQYPWTSIPACQCVQDES